MYYGGPCTQFKTAFVWVGVIVGIMGIMPEEAEGARVPSPWRHRRKLQKSEKKTNA